ncbi:hypothetical protein NMYAN_250028 [Nitrosomonas nitrosa]|uniref:Uncharacterized protein n=1 Tax=Nitrosomonas nitrosa TaxID=52442 RepID=A0A8H9DA86_9PROT|nr:hypothetical protein NMYAN_250028 [Nitrosomonas nitrosa]
MRTWIVIPHLDIEDLRGMALEMRKI